MTANFSNFWQMQKWKRRGAARRARAEEERGGEPAGGPRPYLGSSGCPGRARSRCSRRSGSCPACCSIFGCTPRSSGCIH